MLIFITSLTLGILLIGLGLFLLHKAHEEEFAIFTFTVAGFVLLAVIVMGGFMITAKAQNQYNFEVLEAEYESLNLRLETAQNTTDKDTVVELNGLYADIYNYNMKIKEIKYWGTNPWTNWFYSQRTVKEGRYVEVKN